MSHYLRPAIPALLASFIFASAACAAPPYPLSDHYDGKRFFNPETVQKHTFWTFLRWQFTRERAPWPASLPPAPKPDLRPVAPGEVQITWIGHSTCLIRFHGWTVIADPVFSERASPVSWAGPRRVWPPALAADELPPVDTVIVSHNHYEHLDLPSLRELHALHGPEFIVPLANKTLLAGEGITRVTELDWWQQVEKPGGSSGATKRITLTPARHWSARGLFDRYEMLWGSFMLEHDGIRVYFAGDTGYGRHFSEIRDRLGAPDVSLIPIGTYEPRWFMRDHHTNPDDAVRAHLDLGSRLSMGIHFGTFQLSDEAIDEPPRALAAALAERSLSPAEFIAPEPGQTIVWKRYGE